MSVDQAGRPLGPYALFIAAYAAALGGFLAFLRLTRRRLPDRVPGRDLALIGLATYKASRLIAKERVTAPVRAPFTEVEAESEAAEVEERPAGTGLRRAVGELLSCPYCVAQWVATALAASFVLAPRLTRFLSAVLAGVAVSDFLQLASRAARKRA